MSDYPQVCRLYQNHHLDSSRWQKYSPRQGDIAIATTYKSGTTWTQWIVLHLLFPDLQIDCLDDYSPWLDFPDASPGNLLEQLEAQTHHPRVIKTHLPLDALPWFEEVRYIAVSRDLRDIGLSLWHHYQSLTDRAYEIVNQGQGDDLPVCPQDFDTFWQDWTTRGAFAWESNGFPAWSPTHFLKTWWDFKHLPNILFVHYADLKNDPATEIKRIANHIGVSASEETIQMTIDRTSFERMKQTAAQSAPNLANLFKGGKTTFFNQGKSGRWKNCLNAHHLELYEQMVEKELPPMCRSWVERS